MPKESCLERTAKGIARKVGLFSDSERLVGGSITGVDLERRYARVVPQTRVIGGAIAGNIAPELQTQLKNQRNGRR